MGLAAVRVLGIDTATWHASVGIIESESLLAERTEVVRSHAVGLLPLIEAVLEEARLTIQEIDAVAVSHGPGSFTGLRISMGVAQGLALATGAAVVGVSTLEALASRVVEPGAVCAMLDARKGEVYWALFERSPAGLVRCSDDVLGTPEAAAKALPAECTVVGDGVERYGEVLAATGDRWRLLPSGAWGPRGGAVARVGAQRIQAGGDPAEAGLEPAYVRMADAELNIR